MLQNLLGNPCIFSVWILCTDCMMSSSLLRICRGVSCSCLSTANWYQSVTAVIQDSEWDISHNIIYWIYTIYVLQMPHRQLWFTSIAHTYLGLQQLVVVVLSVCNFKNGTLLHAVNCAFDCMKTVPLAMLYPRKWDCFWMGLSQLLQLHLL